jgi:hypothetical protein
MVSYRPMERDWPTIHVLGLPSRERKSAQKIQTSLFNLAFYAHDFSAAVALFDESYIQSAREAITRETGWGSNWMALAARDGAISINNFGKAMEATTAPLGGCPTVLALLDRDALKLARKLMRDLFPSFEAIRHSVAHSAELHDKDKHSVPGPVELVPGFVVGSATIPVVIRSGLNGRKFQNTFEGKLQSYEISVGTLNGLNSVKTAIYSAFVRVETETLASSASIVT